ncbi:MAG: hypothetical protein RLZ31_900, partial [Pseudomonadota bacterium]
STIANNVITHRVIELKVKNSVKIWSQSTWSKEPVFTIL